MKQQSSPASAILSFITGAALIALFYAIYLFSVHIIRSYMLEVLFATFTFVSAPVFIFLVETIYCSRKPIGIKNVAAFIAPFIGFDVFVLTNFKEYFPFFIAIIVETIMLCTIFFSFYQKVEPYEKQIITGTGTAFLLCFLFSACCLFFIGSYTGIHIFGSVYAVIMFLFYFFHCSKREPDKKQLTAWHIGNTVGSVLIICNAKLTSLKYSPHFSLSIPDRYVYAIEAKTSFIEQDFYYYEYKTSVIDSILADYSMYLCVFLLFSILCIIYHLAKHFTERKTVS